MVEQDWLITTAGHAQPWPRTTLAREQSHAYRLYRFLTEVEDVLIATEDDYQRLEAIHPLVRQLLADAPWLQYEVALPDPAQGWSVTMLYDEPDFPLTVQTVVWLPGQVSPIHNHATWGVVALLSGKEKNTLWQRKPIAEHPQQIEQRETIILHPGDIISVMPDSIHSVEAMGEQPTVTFNLYGLTDYEARFTFDPVLHTATLF
ncbi:MAG: cupin [Acaryochloridaceae cyanobacterium SU_2_1]|nr:cupin [Acaryochloridaceae cyanobacterium SU_2_1]